MVPKGTLVVTEGEPALSMYVVLEGSLRVFVGNEDGREVQLNRIGPGSYFGELMLDGESRSASVQAMTKARLYMITRDAFRRRLAEQPELAFHVIQTLIHRVRALSRSVQGLVSRWTSASASCGCSTSERRPAMFADQVLIASVTLRGTVARR